MTAEETPETPDVADAPTDVPETGAALSKDAPEAATTPAPTAVLPDDAPEADAELPDETPEEVVPDEAAEADTEVPDEVVDVDASLPDDVLVAGAALGEPVPDEPDPRLRTLRVLLIVDAVLLCAAAIAVGVLINKNTGLLLVCGGAILVLAAIAGALLRLTAKLRVPAVVLFEDGLVHASTGEPVAIAWADVKLAYITAGKLVILQQEDGPDFVLRAPTANLAKIESAIRKGVPRDRVRRGLPPKNLAAV